MINTTVTEKARDEVPGSIGKKWGVTGVAAVKEFFTEADVTTEYDQQLASNNSRVLARAHELGHVSVAQDYVDGMDLETAWDSYRQTPVFENEVEAWLRGIEKEFGGQISGINSVHLILDCLNSYRRGRGATDAQWTGALAVIADFYAGPASDVWDYEPLEPEANEEIQNCQPQVTGPAQEAEEGEPAPEDAEDGGEGGGTRNPMPEGDAPEDQPEDGRTEGSSGRAIPNTADQDVADDAGWLDQKVLDDLNEGRTIREVAARYGLNPAKVPPLAAAIAGE